MIEVGDLVEIRHALPKYNGIQGIVTRTGALNSATGSGPCVYAEWLDTDFLSDTYPVLEKFLEVVHTKETPQPLPVPSLPWSSLHADPLKDILNWRDRILRQGR